MMAEWFDFLWSWGPMWLGYYLLHSTVFLLLAWLLVRRPLVSSLAMKESLWKFAVMAGFLTATLHSFGINGGALNEIDPESFTGPSFPAMEHVAAAPYTVAAPGDGRAPLPHAVAANPATNSVRTANLDWTALTLWAYAFVVAILLCRAAFFEWRFRRQIASRRTLSDGPLAASLDRLMIRARLDGNVALSVCDSLEGPIAFGCLRRGEICFPSRVLHALSDDEREALFAHELAHLVRRDGLWLRLMAVVKSVGFFQPLNYLAARRIAGLGELICDDWALSQRANGYALASCLAEVASWLRCPQTAPGAAGMAELRSPLGKRVERALRSDIERTTTPLAFRVAAGAAAFALVWCLLPVVSWAAQDDPAYRPNSGIEAKAVNSESRVALPAAHRDDGENKGLRQYRDGWHSLFSSVDIRASGPATIRLDEGGVAQLQGLAKDGSLELSERSGLVFRSVKVTADEDGKLQYAYTKNGSNQPFGEDEEAWFADLIGKSVLHGPIGAASMVEGLCASGGVEAVAAYVRGLSKTWPQAVYYGLLLRRPEITVSQAGDVIRDATAVLSNDAWALQTFLADVMPIAKANPELDEAYAQGVAALTEAWQRNELLHCMIEGEYVRSGLLPVMTEGLDSGERSTVLLEAAPVWLGDAQLAKEFLLVTREVANEDARRSLLIVAAKNAADEAPELQRDALSQVISEGERLSSASQRADLLKWIGRLAPASLAGSYLDAVEGLPSRRLQERALTWFLERGDVPEAARSRGAGLV